MFPKRRATISKPGATKSKLYSFRVSCLFKWLRLLLRRWPVLARYPDAAARRAAAAASAIAIFR
jgi:hypothetical protein